MLTDLHEITVGMENKLNLDLTIEPMRQIQDEAEYRTWNLRRVCLKSLRGKKCISMYWKLGRYSLQFIY